MNPSVLKKLEFDKIVHQVIPLAVTHKGKKQLEALVPFNDLSVIEAAQTETEESLGLILKYGSLPMGRIGDMSRIVGRLKIGGILSIQELLAISDLLKSVKRVMSYGQQSETIGQLGIFQYFECLVALSPLKREIDRCIIGPDEVADDASSALHGIRKNMQQAHDKIRQQLSHIITSSTYKTYLQDPIVTIKNDRYCVPVKAEHKSHVKGMVHDHSATGSTVFIEPLAVVELNNKIRDLIAEEANEIEKILAILSEAASEHMTTIKTNEDLLVRLDVLFAKAELAIRMHATRPIINQHGYIHLKQARHPLLDPKTVVPTNIHIGDTFSTLIITGPNTGGKTVTLKTVGLLSLMGLSGLHIPTSDRSELALFTEIYADIGDEQSIEQSLSTFSSHMVNIVEILKHADHNSLVLFDELGAGTDPVEGAALAMAILNATKHRGITTLSTTHYSELKAYALTTNGVTNASCEFDVNTLSPTYKLLIGIPGKSNAFAISKRLGLTPDIIESAKALMENQAIQFEDLITDLEFNKKSAIIEKDRAKNYRKEAETLKAQVEAEKENLKITKARLLKEAKQEAYRFVEQAKQEADEIVKVMKSNSHYDHRLLEQERTKLRDKMNRLSEGQLASANTTPALDPALIQKGDTVYVATLDQEGVVLTPPNDKGDLVVQLGIMKTTVPVSQVKRASKNNQAHDQHHAPSKKTPTGTNTTGTSRASLSKVSHIKTELDVRGETVEHALGLLDKYLDDAYLSNLPLVTIIHGKGTGTLRSAIHQHLRKVNYIDTFRLGEYGEGDAGVTIITFKM